MFDVLFSAAKICYSNKINNNLQTYPSSTHHSPKSFPSTDKILKKILLQISKRKSVIYFIYLLFEQPCRGAYLMRTRLIMLNTYCNIIHCASNKRSNLLRCPSMTSVQFRDIYVFLNSHTHTHTERERER